MRSARGRGGDRAGDGVPSGVGRGNGKSGARLSDPRATVRRSSPFDLETYVAPIDKRPPEPVPPEDAASEKEPYDDVEDACDGCGATGVPLRPVETRSARGGRFETLLCPKCRRRHRTTRRDV